MITSAEEFIKLRDSDVREEYTRADWDEASIEVWMDIIERYPDYRKYVARNKTIPLEIIEVLAKDTDGDVRGRIANRRATPPHVLEWLAKDPYDSIRGIVARHWKATHSLLESLASHDSSEMVREKAQKRLELLSMEARVAGAPASTWIEIFETMPDWRSWVVQHKKLPKELISVFAEHPDENVQDDVLRREKLPFELVERFFKDPRAWRRWMALRKRNATPQMAKIALQDPDEDVREIAREMLSLLD